MLYCDVIEAVLRGSYIPLSPFLSTAFVVMSLKLFLVAASFPLSPFLAIAFVVMSLKLFLVAATFRFPPFFLLPLL